jgi:hypothetical protein
VTKEVRKRWLFLKTGRSLKRRFASVRMTTSGPGSSSPPPSIAKSFARNRATAVSQASGEPAFLKLKTALFPMICLTASFSPTKLRDRNASSLTRSLSTARPFAESGNCIRSARDEGLAMPRSLAMIWAMAFRLASCSKERSRAVE